jgi:hypothetical protein
VLQISENISIGLLAQPNSVRQANLTLRNGDLLSGKVLNEKFSIGIDGRTLEISKEELTKIEFVDDPKNQVLFIKQHGEVIVGTVVVEAIKVQMDLGPTVEILNDKIKSISFTR